MNRGLLVGLLLLAGCPSDDEVEYARFNGDDFVEVGVGPGEIGEPVSVELMSTTGAVVVGVGTVDPGFAPAGTDHDVTVELRREYRDVVARVTIVADAGARGVETFELTRDSADHGHWYAVVRSVGTVDETRTDTFGFELYTIVEPAE